MVSKGYQVWRQRAKIHISITLTAIGSRDLKIAPKIIRLPMFFTRQFLFRPEKKNGGFPRRFDR